MPQKRRWTSVKDLFLCSVLNFPNLCCFLTMTQFSICAICALVCPSFSVVIINNQRQGQDSISFRHTPYILRHMRVLFYRSLIFERGKLSLELSHATCLSLLPVHFYQHKKGLGSVVWRYRTMKAMLLIFTLIIFLCCATQAAFAYGYGDYEHYQGYGGFRMHWPLSESIVIVMNL